MKCLLIKKGKKMIKKTNEIIFKIFKDTNKFQNKIKNNEFLCLYLIFF